MKLPKPLIFISGFVAGVCTAIVVALYHDIMSMQPQPVVEDDLYDGLCLEHITRAIDNLPDWLEPADYLDDTQPVYVGEPDGFGAWQLEQFAKESE